MTDRPNLDFGCRQRENLPVERPSMTTGGFTVVWLVSRRGREILWELLIREDFLVATETYGKSLEGVCA